MPDERHQEAVQVPRAGRDVEDRVGAGLEVAVQLRRAREGRPGEGGAGQRSPDHLPDPLDAGLQDGVVDVRDDPELCVVTGDQYLERRDLRIGNAAVLVGELDSPAGPRGCEPTRLWLQAHPEVAVGVGDGLDSHARDGDPQRNTRQVVGQEPLHGTAHGGADALALHGFGGDRIIEDPSAHHHPVVTSVADVRLDAQVDRHSGASSPQPRPVPGLLQPAGPTTRTHGHTLGSPEGSSRAN